MKVKEMSIKRPGRLLSVLFRLPLILYRVGLGSLMGMQILLSTVGRRSGKSHKVVVDIIAHDKTNDVYYVSAAFGHRSDWYLNLKANPIIEAQIGWRKFTIRTTTLPGEEAQDILIKFVRRYPRYSRFMMRVIGVRTSLSENVVRALASQMPVVACTPVVAKKDK